MNDPMARGGVRRYLDTVTPEEYIPDTGEVNLKEMTLTGLADLFGSDKGNVKHCYTEVYERIVAEMIRTEGQPRHKCVFEIAEAGVACGASLHMWAHYLPASNITGFDIREECASLCKDLPNVDIYIQDLCKTPPDDAMYDLFIDDASHISEQIAEIAAMHLPRDVHAGLSAERRGEVSGVHRAGSDHAGWQRARAAHDERRGDRGVVRGEFQ